MRHIVCFHLFNDYSGSPKVLCQVLNKFLEQGYSVDLITSRGGILSSLEGKDNLRIRYYNYRFSDNSVVTMFRYCKIQLYTFLLGISYLFKTNTVFYINTLLPLGPAVAGKMIGKRVFYHYHENASAKGGFYKVLSWGMQKIATKIICVSLYQSKFLKRKKGVVVIPNVLPEDFSSRFKMIEERKLEYDKIILMLSSLKIYKGVFEFVKLANQLPQYKFELVLNDESENINSFFINGNVECPINLTIFDRQKNIIPFYQRASLVLNLTDKKLCIETFGLTILEAMTAALPVIVPTEGGIIEMVEDGVNGYKIDVEKLGEIKTCINKILSDPELYSTLSFNAKHISKAYTINKMGEDIINVLSPKTRSNPSC